MWLNHVQSNFLANSGTQRVSLIKLQTHSVNVHSLGEVLMMFSPLWSTLPFKILSVVSDGHAQMVSEVIKGFCKLCHSDVFYDFCDGSLKILGVVKSDSFCVSLCPIEQPKFIGVQI